MQYLSFIENSLQEASMIAIGDFGKVSGTTKGEDNNQVLTKADLAIGKLLTEKVQMAFPDHNIIDEEAGVVDNNSDYTWVIDPIDGTSNFASGVPTYGVMLGLLNQGMPVAGGIAYPYFSSIALAEKKKGAFKNGKRICVSYDTRLLNVLVAYHIDSHRENPKITRDEVKLLGEIILHIRNLRSSCSAYDILQVAEGHYGGVLNRTSKIWDNVAPQIIIEEAGGIYTDFFGNPINYTNPLTKTGLNFNFCAAAPALHGQLQKIIHGRY